MLKDYFRVFSSNELPQKVPSKKTEAGWAEKEFAILTMMVPLIHRPPGCTEEFLTGFLCPRDAKRGRGRVKWPGVGGSAGHNVREEQKSLSPGSVTVRVN